ncbi:MAG: LLM class flavin-dependent oxidoreductase [Streptomycetales bacterium]
MSGIRFHWRLFHGGDLSEDTRGGGWELAPTGLPDLERQVEFCRAAELSGIDSLLTDFGFAKPDSILLSAALGQRTERTKFIIAYRSGLICPTSFVQQLNTLSTLINGRFSLNIVAGHSPAEQRGYGDYLPREERYARTEEFLAVCHAFWRGDDPVTFDGRYYKVEGARLNTPFVSPSETFPELFIAGGSQEAHDLAISQGSCWMVLAEPPDQLAPRASGVLRHGRTVGIRCAVIVRPTREEAIEAAYDRVAGRDTDREREQTFVRGSDSVSINNLYRLAKTEWLTPYLWAGAVRTHGPAAVALVGSPDDIAAALLDYKRAGVTQFILSSWPKLEQMVYFGEEVIPRVREREASVPLPIPAGSG